MPKWLKFILLGGAGLAGVGLGIIRFDTPAAAEFADNYLRPIFGARLVVAVEKIYYNSADRIDKVLYSNSTRTKPVFDHGTVNRMEQSATNLSLVNLPVNEKFKPVDGEGIWNNLPVAAFPNQEVMAYTFIRPDPDRPYTYVTLVQIDSRVIKLGVVAGTKQPGGPVGKPGPGKIPAEIVTEGKLIAAFDGGFQYRDGEYGMIVGQTTYLPLQLQVGTLVGYTDGTVKIFNYTGQDLGNEVAFVRQNCPILINDGKISILDPLNKHLWGRTFSADIYTWRSGIGQTKDGNLVYAVGNNLAPLTLSQALKTAGAENAIQLDINPFWVRFNIFNYLGNGKYNSHTLTKGLYDGSRDYINGYSKDFFYLYKNS